MSQDNTFTNIQPIYVPQDSLKLEVSYDQDNLSSYLEPEANDVFDTRRFTPHASNSHLKNSTPKERRSQSPATIKNSSLRPNSARLVSKCLYKLIGEIPKSHGHLSKRIENLEKKQDQWRERAHVWNKQRKTLKNALENIAKHPSEFYKDHLKTWNDSQTLYKNKPKLQNFPKSADNIIDWIKAQPDDYTVHDIKKIIEDNSSDPLENSFSQTKLDVKHTDQYFKNLNEKNQELCVSLLKIENELKIKVQSLEVLKDNIAKLQNALNEKEKALVQEKAINETLMTRIKDQGLPDTGHSRKLIKLENELETKELKIIFLETENTKLANSLEHYKSANKVYINTIDELTKKLHIARLESCDKYVATDKETDLDEISSLEDLDSLSDVLYISASTQTSDEQISPEVSNELNKPKPLECFSYISCMANVVEEMLAIINK